jgi:archaellum component FlaC
MADDILSWNEWGTHILKELERLNTNIEKIKDQLDAVKVDIGQLKIKAGAIGAIAGTIPSAVYLILKFIEGK